MRREHRKACRTRICGTGDDTLSSFDGMSRREKTTCRDNVCSLVRVANKQMQTSRGVHIEGIGLVACLAAFILTPLFAGMLLRLDILANEEPFCDSYLGSFISFMQRNIAA